MNEGVIALCLVWYYNGYISIAIIFTLILILKDKKRKKNDN